MPRPAMAAGWPAWTGGSWRSCAGKPAGSAKRWRSCSGPRPSSPRRLLARYGLGMRFNQMPGPNWTTGRASWPTRHCRSGMWRGVPTPRAVSWHLSVSRPPSRAGRVRAMRGAPPHMQFGAAEQAGEMAGEVGTEVFIPGAIDEQYRYIEGSEVAAGDAGVLLGERWEQRPGPGPDCGQRVGYLALTEEL